MADIERLNQIKNRSNLSQEELAQINIPTRLWAAVHQHREKGRSVTAASSMFNAFSLSVTLAVRHKLTVEKTSGLLPKHFIEYEQQARKMQRERKSCIRGRDFVKALHGKEFFIFGSFRLLFCGFIFIFCVSFLRFSFSSE